MKPSSLPVPAAVLTQHIAALGKTGSGKTSTAKLLIEHVVAEGARVCVLDPIKSDWWGLTSSADGKKPGLPFHILGGPRGHVPLHQSAGAAIAEIVANGSLPLSIIDMADFGPGGQAKFFTDFAPMLLKKMRGVVYLVLEEAHVFAPKERSGLHDENMAVHWAKMLATAGRSKGIRLILVTQRTQALHNALLGSCDTMIAHRLTAPADQAPVINWLKANTSKAVLEDVTSSLSSLPKGDAWVCSGEAMHFERVHFPRIATFDNTATPTGDGEVRDVKTAAVDKDKLRAIIGDAVEEAKANDPQELKRRIAELQSNAIGPDIVKCPSCGKPPRTPGLILPYSCPHCRTGVLRWVGIDESKPEAAGKPALTDADRKLLEKLATSFQQIEECAIARVKSADDRCVAIVTKAVNDFHMEMTEVHFDLAKKLSKELELASVKKLIEKLNGLAIAPTVRGTSGSNYSGTIPQSQQTHSNQQVAGGLSSRASDTSSPPPQLGDVVMKQMHRNMLITLAQSKVALTKKQIRARTGYADSGPVSSAFADLARAGWTSSTGTAAPLQITRAGLEALGPYEPLPTGAALRAHVLSGDRLSTMERNFMTALFEVYPKDMAKKELRERFNYADSGPVSSAFGHLVAIDFAAKGSANGRLRAASEFFEVE